MGLAALGNPGSGTAPDSAAHRGTADRGRRSILAAMRYRVSVVAGVLTTVVGNGLSGFSGDGAPARDASVDWPFSLALDARGNLFFGDFGNQRVRVATQPRVEEHAREKLQRKNLDLIVANDVSGPAGSFGSGANRVVVLDRDGGRAELSGTKLSVAHGIWDRVRARLA